MKKAIFLLIIFLPLKVMANGYTLPDTGGNFSSPVDPNPSAIYWNPSAISFSEGINAFLDISPFYFRARYKRSGDSYERVSYEGTDFLPLVGATYTMRMKKFIKTLSGGIAFYVPFGAEAHYPEDGPQKFQGVDGGNYLMNLSPSISLKITDFLSIGFALNIGFGSFYANGSALIDENGGEIPSNEAKYEFKDLSGIALGYSAGLFLRPARFLDIGVSWTSPMNVVHSGKYRFYATEESKDLFDLIFNSSDITGDADVEIDYPMFLSFGAKVKPTNRFEFNITFQWFDWSYYEIMKIRIKNGKDRVTGKEANVGFIEKMDYQTNFEDAISFKIDARYKPFRRWIFLLGAGYDQSGIPDTHLSVMNLEFDKIEILAGALFEVSRNIFVSGGVNFYIPFGRDVKNSELKPPANGRYSAEGFKGDIGIGFKL
jgi:long-subunit fatty acid transport protein